MKAFHIWNPTDLIKIGLRVMGFEISLLNFTSGWVVRCWTITISEQPHKYCWAFDVGRRDCETWKARRDANFGHEKLHLVHFLLITHIHTQCTRPRMDGRRFGTRCILHYTLEPTCRPTNATLVGMYGHSKGKISEMPSAINWDRNA